MAGKEERKMSDEQKKLKEATEEKEKEEKNKTRYLIALMVSVLSAAGLVIGGVIMGLGLAGGIVVSLGLVGAFFLQGLRRIPADPPHKAVVTKWGKRQDFEVAVEIDGEKKKVKKALVKDEGWRFFPVYPYFYGYIKIDVTRKNTDFPIQSVRTPDMGEIDIPLSITYTPDPGHLIEYLNNKGEAGVNGILEDIVRQKLREWAVATEEGPQTWEEAMKARDEAILILAKAILGDELARIRKPDNTPSQVPTAFWFKYFYTAYFRQSPEQYPDEDDEEFKRREKEWKTIKDLIKKETNDENEEDTSYIRKQVDNRKGEIDNVRRGNGVKHIKHLGIILNRLNLGEFKVKGDLAKAAELRAKEKREMVAEKFELQHISNRIKELISPPFNYSPEQALEIVQTERGKVPKTISESKWNVSAETRAMIEKIGPKIAAAVSGKGKKRRG
jgi:hypothetical protein